MQLKTKQNKHAFFKKQKKNIQTNIKTKKKRHKSHVALGGIGLLENFRGDVGQGSTAHGHGGVGMPNLAEAFSKAKKKRKKKQVCNIGFYRFCRVL